MNDEKLDLILAAVTEIKADVNNIKADVNNIRVDVKNLDSRMGNVENGFIELRTEVKSDINGLRTELSAFKKQMIKAFDAMKNRIDLLEKQMLSIGYELKEDIRREGREVREEIDRLENTIMLEQAEKLQDRVRVRELESRVTRLEEKFRLAA